MRYAKSMSITKDEAELRRRVRERCKSGRLPPSAAPGRAWAGRGSGRACSLCDQPIDPDEIEYELDGPSGVAIDIVRFHTGCYRLWSVECARG